MTHVVRPRLPHAAVRSPRRATARSSACGSRSLADHGAFNGTAQPTKFPAGFFHVFTGSLRPAGRVLRGHRRLHEQGAGRRRVRLLVPHHRGRLPGRAHRGPARRRAGHGPRRAAAEEPPAARAVPVHLRRPAGSTTPATTRGRCGWRWRWPATTSCAREQAEKRARGELMGIGISFFTEAVGAGPRKHMDILGLGMADGAELRVHPTGKAVLRHLGADPGPGPRDDVRADRRARSWASRPRTSRWCTATPTRPRSAWAPTAPVRRRCPARRPPSWPARCASGRGSSPPPCWRLARTTWSGSRAAGTSRATRTRARRSRRSRWPRTAPGAARGRRGAPGRQRPSTTRRT